MELEREPEQLLLRQVREKRMEKRELQCCLALGRAGEERGREEKPHPLPVAAEAWDDEMDPQPSTEWEDHRKVTHNFCTL